MALQVFGLDMGFRIQKNSLYQNKICSKTWALQPKFILVVVTPLTSRWLGIRTPRTPFTAPSISVEVGPEESQEWKAQKVKPSTLFFETAHLTAHLPVKIMVNPSSYSKYTIVKDSKHIPSSRLTVCYGIDGPLIEDLPLKMGDFPVRYVK